MTNAPITIIGGGLAALSATRALRKTGFDGDIVVATAEHHHPYERPPLTKDYLRGESDRSATLTTPPEWYAENGVDVRTGATAIAIDRANRRVEFADGTEVDYRRLLLATGSSPRPLHLPGADLRGTHTLRTVDDADLLASEFAAAGSPARLVVIGDGWIGMEVAASARQLGLDVTVIGRGSVPLAKVIGPSLGSMYADLHRANGVRLITDARVAEVVGHSGRVKGVRLSNSEVISTDVVVAGVGAAPNVGIAKAAALHIRDASLGGGVATVPTLATSDPSIFAAGDIASIPYSRWRRPIRVDHWATALRSGAHAARAMLGVADPYDRIPYFYSDQFDTSMEYTGYVPDAAADEVVISGDLERRSFVAFWVRRGQVEAGLTMNQPGRIHEIDELIRSQRQITPEQLETFATDAVHAQAKS